MITTTVYCHINMSTANEINKYHFLIRQVPFLLNWLGWDGDNILWYGLLFLADTRNDEVSYLG